MEGPWEDWSKTSPAQITNSGATSPICKPHREFNAAQSGNPFRDEEKDEIAHLAKSYFFWSYNISFANSYLRFKSNLNKKKRK